MPRLRPIAAVVVLLLTALVAPTSQEVVAADGRARPVATPRQAAPVPASPANAERAPDSADAADDADGEAAIALLLAVLGAVGLMASRVRRPD